MGKTIFGKNTPKGSPFSAVTVHPEMTQLAQELKNLMIARTGQNPTPFDPDPLGLLGVVRSLPIQEQWDIKSYLSCPYRLFPAVESLIQLDSLLKYDNLTKRVFEKFKERSDDPSIEGFKTLMVFMTFILNGPRLSVDGVKGVDSQRCGDMVLSKVNDGAPFTMYNMVYELGNYFSQDVPMFRWLNVSLMAHAIEALPPESRYTVKSFFDLPLSKEENAISRHRRVEPQDLKTVKAIARFKELTLFPEFGPWDVTSVLAFPGLKFGAPITHKSVSALFKNLNTLKQAGFDCSGVKRIKQRTLLTRFGGTRPLKEYLLGVYQWEFTDPLELRMLYDYLSVHIEDLKFN